MKRLSTLFLMVLFTLFTITSVWAVTKYQEVTVTVHNANAGTCGAAPMGAAAALVTEAGFNTCYLYNDFTTPIPNAVGTGLPGIMPTSNNTPAGNWMNCHSDDTYTAGIWYWNFYSYSGAAPADCTLMSQDVDSVGGVRALHISASGAQNVSGNVDSGTSFETVTNTPGVENSAPHGTYSEITFRYIHSASMFLNWWMTGGLPANTTNPCATGYGQELEIDFIEFDSSPPTTDTGIIRAGDSCAQPGGLGVQPWPYGEDDIRWENQYNTIGALMTNDGDQNLTYTLFFNGVEIENTGQYSSNPGFAQVRSTFIFFLNGHENGNPWDFWLQDVKVWTCGSFANSTCGGTSYDGTNQIYAGAS